MEFFAHILVYVGAGLAAHEFFRRYPKLSWILYLVIPISLTPLWVKNNPTFSPFLWVKIYSVLFGCWWLLILRFSRLSTKRWAFRLTELILILNILEAVLFNSYTKIPGHYFNAAAGVLLIATLPSLRSFHIDKEGKFHDVLWGLPYGWIWGYTFWNWTFVYLCFPAAAGREIPMLLAPLVASFIKRELWLQARAATLGFYFMMAFTFPYFLGSLGTAGWENDTFEIAASAFTLLWMILYFLKTKGKKLIPHS